ncbi:MAG: hypothetical protein ACOYXM_01060 [Actinomycetota bacterium]
MRTPPTQALRTVALVSVVLAASAAFAPAPTSAGTAEPASAEAANAPSAPLTLSQPSAALPGLPPISRDLSRVAVDGPAFRRARASYEAAADVLAAEQSRRVQIDHALAEVATQTTRARADRASALARLAALRTRLDEVDGAIADLAIGIYMTGGPAARVDAALATDTPAVNDADRRDVLGTASLDVLLAERAAYQQRIEVVEERLTEAQAAAGDLGRRSRDLIAERPTAMEAELAAAPAVAQERVAYEAARTLATVEGVEFPLVALDAYYRAARTTAEEAPRCQLRWWALAGISRVEGHHGSYGGVVLDAKGDTSRPIIGIPLDGSNNTRVVHDTDDGALDGDPTYDRAVGPMQFIPETWRRFSADGNEDGEVTPFNMYDATLAASRYLCRASGALNADPGLRSAYFSYNHSPEYVERVLSFARFYERTLELPDPL